MGLTGLRHIYSGHPVIEDDQGAFFRCLDRVIKFASPPYKNGNQSGYKLLSMAFSGGYWGYVVVDNNHIPATVVTAYTSYDTRITVSPKSAKASALYASGELGYWQRCGAS